MEAPRPQTELGVGLDARPRQEAVVLENYRRLFADAAALFAVDESPSR